MMSYPKYTILVAAVVFGAIAVLSHGEVSKGQSEVATTAGEVSETVQAEAAPESTPMPIASAAVAVPVVDPVKKSVRTSTPAPVVTPTPVASASPSVGLASAPAEVTLPAETSSAPQVHTGLQGMMLIDGGCPVMRIDLNDPSTDPNCEPRPFPSTVSVYNADTNVYVMELTSKPNGHYKVDLVPGRYFITTNIDYFMRPTMPWLPPVTVTVGEHGYEHFNIMFDSGIR